MADVIDMIFGRIDRGTDDRLRTRALAQNNEQFLLQQKLEQDRLAAERERMAEAARQFGQQMLFNREGREDSRAAAYMQAIHSGMARPTQAADTMGAELPSNPLPGNIFMRQGVTTPMAAPGGVGQASPTAARVGQYSMTPVSFEDRQRLETDLAMDRAKKQFDMTQQQQLSEVDFLEKHGGIPRTIAVLASKGGRVGEILASNPGLLFGVMKANGNPVADKMLQTMIDYLASKSEAEQTEAQELALREQAGYHRRMPAAAMGGGSNAATYVSPEGRLLMGEAVTALRNRGIMSTDPRFTSEAYNYIISTNHDGTRKSEALKALGLEGSLNPQRQDFLSGVLNQVGAPPATVTSGTPAPAQAQPSGPPPRPQPQAQPQQQPGSAALQYTQPTKPSPNAQGLFPVYRNDGSIDGWVTSDQWDQLMLSKPSGLGINMWAPFQYLSEADKRRRDEGLRRVQEEEARRRALGIR